AWTDAAHLDAWHQGGRTDLHRTVPACPGHHDLMDLAGWKVELDPHTATCTWTSPDGRTVICTHHRTREHGARGNASRAQTGHSAFRGRRRLDRARPGPRRSRRPGRPATALGEAVNVAARLQSVASPGRVVISADTYRLVASVVDALKLGAVQLRGKNERGGVQGPRGRSASSNRPPPWTLPRLGAPPGRHLDLLLGLAENRRLTGYPAGAHISTGTPRSARVMARPVPCGVRHHHLAALLPRADTLGLLALGHWPRV
ncbi:MAG: adenylate/guanylate cyclase domain-containing protein, partial [Nitriliruptorales bacterium]